MSIAVRILPMGGAALLVEVDTVGEVVSLADALRAQVDTGQAPWDKVTDVVPAARTVLLAGAAPLPLPALEQAIRQVAGGAQAGAGHRAGETVVVPTRYDGDDLAAVAQLTGLSPDEVVAAHTGTPWTVAFDGFAPGFAYLVGGDRRLQVPRRENPRTRVPAGSVALAGEFSAVYPRESPGGWQLIGRTDLSLWDTDRDPPARLMPGTTVRFTDATGDAR